jgi:hypothetical protein
MTHSDQEKAYLEERKLLIESGASQSASFDKYVLTISSGFLGFSLVFIKDIVPSYDECTRLFAIVGWIFLIISMIFTLLSLLIGQFSFNKQIKLNDQDFEQDKWGQNTSTNPWQRPVVLANVISIICLIAGSASLTAFVAFNF